MKKSWGQWNRFLSEYQRGTGLRDVSRDPATCPPGKQTGSRRLVNRKPTPEMDNRMMQNHKEKTKVGMRATAEATTAIAQEALTRPGEEKETEARVNTNFFTRKEWKALGQYVRDRNRNPKQLEYKRIGFFQNMAETDFSNT